MTTPLLDIESTIDADPLGEALSRLRVETPELLRLRVLSGVHALPRRRLRRRTAGAALAGVAAAAVLAATPAGHAIARTVLPEGLQQRLGLVEGAPQTLRPPSGAVSAGAGRPSMSPMPCSAAPTPGPGRSGGGFACFPDLSVAAAQAKVDFRITLPSALPPGLRYRGALTTDVHDVYLSWLSSDGQPGALGLEIRDGAGLAGGSAVPAGAPQPVQVDGGRGYVVRGDYEDSGPGTTAHWNPNADDYELTWTRGGLTYNLTAGGLHLSVPDLVRIAESIP